MKRLVVAMTGATGAPLGVHLLQILRDIPEVQIHFAGTPPMLSQSGMPAMAATRIIGPPDSFRSSQTLALGSSCTRILRSIIANAADPSPASM